MVSKFLNKLLKNIKKYSSKPPESLKDKELDRLEKLYYAAKNKSEKKEVYEQWLSRFHELHREFLSKAKIDYTVN